MVTIALRSTHCRRCNRALSNPKSVTNGMGPVCWARIDRVSETGELNDDTYDLPFDLTTKDVVCQRITEYDDDGNPDWGYKRFNIPWLLSYHSPTGMEWGYRGSGPRDFAINILYHHTRDLGFSNFASNEFKDAFISPLPREGGTISGKAIEDWVMAMTSDWLRLNQWTRDSWKEDLKRHATFH